MSEQAFGGADALVEDDVTVSMMRRVSKMTERAEAIASMDPRDLERNYPTPEARAALEREREALIGRAAEIIAKYGIDRAMLAASGKLADGTVDQVFLAARPFAEQMNDLFSAVAGSMGAKLVWVKNWNPLSGPKARGGVPRGGYDYGYRVFAYQSDVLRIEVLYASLRNQALAAVAQIVDSETKFGQRQKAMRQEFLIGFVAGVRSQIREAEQVARERAEAADREAKDKALEAGQLGAGQGPSVALVLADRKEALNRAYDLARGITPEQRAKWEANSKRYADEAAERQRQREAEIAACERCKKAKTGRCNAHRIRYGRLRYRQERVGEAAGMFEAGHAAGRRADLGTRSGSEVGSEGRRAL